MAIWQFCVCFIPAAPLRARYGFIPTIVDVEVALDIPWWKDIRVCASEIRPFLVVFGDVQEWSKNTEGMTCYGNDERDDIAVLTDTDGFIEELHVRLDVRQINRELFHSVIILAKQFDCLLMDSKGSLLQPTPQALGEAIFQSEANRFLCNPTGFLDSLLIEE